MKHNFFAKNEYKNLLTRIDSNKHSSAPKITSATCNFCPLPITIKGIGSMGHQIIGHKTRPIGPDRCTICPISASIVHGPLDHGLRYCGPSNTPQCIISAGTMSWSSCGLWGARMNPNRIIRSWAGPSTRWVRDRRNSIWAWSRGIIWWVGDYISGRLCKGWRCQIWKIICIKCWEIQWISLWVIWSFGACP